MNVIGLQVFVSLMLVLSSVVLFVFTVRSRTFEHVDRLSLAPLEADRLDTEGSESARGVEVSSSSELNEPVAGETSPSSLKSTRGS
jgi:hypothetical protein